MKMNVDKLMRLLSNCS